jgi:hypothetical protein
MTTKELKSALPPETIQKVQDALNESPSKINTLWKAAVQYLGLSNIANLILLLENSDFLDYLRKRAKTPEGRLQTECEIIFQRIANHTNPLILGKVLSTIVNSYIFSIFRKFFKVPIDEVTAKEFLIHLIRVGESDLSKMNLYARFFETTNFLEIRANYKEIHFVGYDNFLSNHRKLYLSSLDPSVIEAAEDSLADSSLLRLIRLTCSNYDARSLGVFFEPFYKNGYSQETKLALRCLDKRYRNSSGTNKKLDELYYVRSTNVFEYILTLDKNLLLDFQAFVSLFGDSKDAFEIFVWNEVFRLPIDKIGFVISLLTSSSFITLKNSYNSDPNILLFLIRNIFTAIGDTKIRNFESGLRKIVLKLLIGLKSDRWYLKRRGEFLYILKKTNNSFKLELEFIRLFFYDYIFNFFNKKGYMDDFHKDFSLLIDVKYPKFLFKRPNISKKMEFFRPIIERARGQLFFELKEYFKTYPEEFEEIKEISQSCNLDDIFLDELKKLNPEELPEYHSTIIDAFKRNPSFVKDAVPYDSYCAVKLEEVVHIIRNQTLFLVGCIHISPGIRGAYTYGNSIYLPEKINLFQDSKFPIEDNRNLTMYMGLALHEVSHIIFGSFNFDLNSYVYSLDKPALFKTIHNIIEDFRIEKCLIHSNLVDLAKDVIPFMNITYSLKNIDDSERSPSFVLLNYISDCSTGNWNEILSYSPSAMDKINELLSLPYSSGRFRNLKEMTENWIERLKNLPFNNPLGSVPLSQEIYEVLKDWPQDAVHDLDEQEEIDKGTHGAAGSSPPKGTASSSYPRSPLTDEQLKEMYDQYNKNPELQSQLSQENQSLLRGDDLLKTLDSNDLIEVDEIDYSEQGTVDQSTRTKTDDQLAEQKKEGLFDAFKTKIIKKIKKKNPNTPSTKVRSLSPNTKSKTRLSEIKEVPIIKKDPKFLKILEQFKDVEIEIEKQLGRYIVPNDSYKLERNAFEGELDIEELIEILSGKEKVGFFEFLEAEMPSPKKSSLEVVIGMDMSGSTAGVADASKGLSILDVEKIFAILFGKALERFAEKVSYMGFDSETATNVYQAKDRLSVSSFHSGGSNRDGDFIRFVKDYLKKSKYELKYFFLLSDGQPSGSNYDGRDALDDTILAMKEVLDHRIRLIYLNVDSVKGSYFDSFVKVATYAEHFSKPTDLIPKIPELVKTLAKAVF